MIKIYREETNAYADTIEAEFRELVLGYDRVLIDSNKAAQLFGADASLPVLTDNTRMICGEQIPAYIKELTQLVHSWRRFQSDCCYVDDDGETY